MKRKPTEADILLWEQLKELSPFGARKEVQFFENRRWRFDFILPPALAIEIEGGAWTQGRHTRGKGFIGDLEKYNYAALLGWVVLRFTPDQVIRGEAIAFIKRVLDSQSGD